MQLDEPHPSDATTVHRVWEYDGVAHGGMMTDEEWARWPHNPNRQQHSGDDQPCPYGPGTCKGLTLACRDCLNQEIVDAYEKGKQRREAAKVTAAGDNLPIHGRDSAEATPVHCIHGRHEDAACYEGACCRDTKEVREAFQKMQRELAKLRRERAEPQGASLGRSEGVATDATVTKGPPLTRTDVPPSPVQPGEGAMQAARNACLACGGAGGREDDGSWEACRTCSRAGLSSRPVVGGIPSKIVIGSKVVTAAEPNRTGFVRNIFIDGGYAWAVVRWEPTMVDSLVDPEVLWLASQFARGSNS